MNATNLPECNFLQKYSSWPISLHVHSVQVLLVKTAWWPKPVITPSVIRIENHYLLCTKQLYHLLGQKRQKWSLQENCYIFYFFCFSKILLIIPSKVPTISSVLNSQWNIIMVDILTAFLWKWNTFSSCRPHRRLSAPHCRRRERSPAADCLTSVILGSTGRWLGGG